MDITAYQHMRISTRGKRPLRNLTPGDKVRAIQRIHNGETKASVSRDIGVPESTLRGWCKNEQKLRFMCRQLGAAISDQGLSMGGIDSPPEKRSKLAETFDYNHSYAYDRLGTLSSVNRLNNASLSMETKNNSFLSNNVIEELVRKNGVMKDDSGKQIFGDSGFLQGINMLSAAGNYSQLPLMQNMNLLSLLNPSLIVPNPITGRKSSSIPIKSPLCAPATSKSVLSKPTKHSTTTTTITTTKTVSAKSWEHDSLCAPMEFNEDNAKNINGDMIDTNDSNNNDVRPSYSLPTSAPKIEYADLSKLFPIGMSFPSFPPANTETSNDVLLQWSKVFNASLSFLALATAAAAIQCPNSATLTPTSGVEMRNCPTSDPSQLLQNPPARVPSYTPPLFDHSEDSNFESEPEDLSVRSGTSKMSSSGNSQPQSPIRDIVSDSLTLSDEEH